MKIKGRQKASSKVPWEFDVFFLGALYGVVLFGLFMAFCPVGIRSQLGNFGLYEVGWIVFPSLGVGCAALLTYLHREYFPDSGDPYPLFVLLNTACVLLTLSPRLWPLKGAYFLFFFLLAQIIGFLSLSKRVVGRKAGAGTGENFYGLTLILLGCWLWVAGDPWPVLAGWHWLNTIFFLGILALFYLLPARGPAAAGPKDKTSRWSLMAEPALTFLIFLLICFCVIDPRFNFNRFHYSFYLGPISDLLAGKALLVDINAQYGVLVFYFLGFIFKFLPLGFTSFCLVYTVLYVLQYFLFYFIARLLFQSKWLSFFCLLSLLLVNYFATYDYATKYPSIGPLRFGFAYLLAASVLLRNLYPARKEWFFWLESGIVVSAFFWSLEVCAYTVPPYVLLSLFESSRYSKGKIDWDGWGLAKRAGIFLTLAVLLGSFLWTDIHFRAHEAPHLDRYLGFISDYRAGLGSIPIEGPGYWCSILGILYFSLFVVAGSTIARKEKGYLPPHLNVIVFLTLYGIFQFLYFLGRSHPNNLLHISMPGIVLTVYWLAVLRRDPIISFLPRAKRYGLVMGVILMAFYLQPFVPRAMEMIRDRFVPFPEEARNIGLAAKDQPRDDAFAIAAGNLMEKYSGGQERLAYFFGERNLEVSMYDHKTHLYPYNDVVQASFSAPTVDHILSFDPGFKKGDCIYVSDDFKQVHIPYPEGYGSRDCVSVLEKQLLLKIIHRYGLRLVDNDRGIKVYGIEGMASPASEIWAKESLGL